MSVTAKKGATFAAPARPDREVWMAGEGRMAQAQTAIVLLWRRSAPLNFWTHAHQRVS